MHNLEYDERVVAPHGNPTGPVVLLVNEAPGPVEAEFGLPLFGQQGANIYHFFRAAGIAWACAFNKFTWPNKGDAAESKRHGLKAAFLQMRAKYLTCSNAYPRWPRPINNLNGFCAPLDADVLSSTNLEYLRSAVSQTHRVILVCGRSAYLACVGQVLTQPASRELTELSMLELNALNRRLNANFERGWYMGHTRRWSLHGAMTTNTLKKVAGCADWEILPSTGS